MDASATGATKRAATACDCCGARAWEYAFTEGGFDLGRCAECGLHYIVPMPTHEQRLADLHGGQYGHHEQVLSAARHAQAAAHAAARYQKHVDLGRRFAPPGRWLDIGCGTGILMRQAQQAGIEIEGIELTADRLATAKAATRATVYDRPIEDLPLTAGSFAAIVMTDVFSHLLSPAQTIARIRELLCPGGVLVLRTGEIGPGVSRHHAFRWELGDHLFFLGDHTIERYADKLGLQLVHREREWQPATVWTRQRFKIRGRSALRNFIKSACVYTPGVFPLLRWYMLTRRHAGNPLYDSSIVLKKPA